MLHDFLEMTNSSTYVLKAKKKTPKIMNMKKRD